MVRLLAIAGEMESYLVAGSVAVLCYLFFRFIRFLNDREQSDGRWHAHGSQMRRWVNASWQYREMTDAEAKQELEEQSDRAW